MTVAQQNQRPISDVRVVAGSRLRSITLNAGEDPAQLPPGGRHSPQPATPPPSTEHPAIPSTWTSLDALELKTKTESLEAIFQTDLRCFHGTSNYLMFVQLTCYILFIW